MDIGPGERVFIYLAEDNAPDLDELVAALRPLGIPFAGIVFPALIAEGDMTTHGVLLKSIATVGDLVVVEDMSDLSTLSSVKATPDASQTAMVLLDSISPHISTFMAGVYDQLGQSVRYFGGGGGFMSFEARDCVFSSESGPVPGGALIAFLPFASGLAARHGWSRINGPLVVTRSEGNVVHEINWEPALEAYRSILKSHSGLEVTQANFGEVSRSYPFGIAKEGAEDVVRDPIRLDDGGSIVCIADIPENSILHVLTGDKDTVIEAASGAAVAALEGSKQKPDSGLIADCITRGLYLGTRFKEEVDAVSRVFQSAGIDAPDGFLTLGEISSSGTGHLEFLNKTIVVCGLHSDLN